ncbi:hypothetical protein ACYOEI_11470 [Singulisphaera rosea]
MKLEYRLVGLITLSMLTWGCSGSRPAEDPVVAFGVGNQCKVYFSRDVLGLGADSPASPTADTIGEVQVFMKGILVKATGDWITVRVGKMDYFIPRDAILMIEMQSP